VLNSKLFDLQKRNTLSDELNIISETGEENFIIDRTDPGWRASLDNYLITSINKIPWKEIVKTETAKPEYGFASVIQKIGRVYYPDTTKSVRDLTQVTFFLQKNKTVYHTFTMEKGKVWLTIPDVYGEDEVLYLVESRRKRITDARIKWDNPPSISFPKASKYKEIKSADSYGYFASKNILINKSYSFYSTKNQENITMKTTTSDFENEIMGADITINVQDYILFSTMEELIKEIVPPLYTRITSKQSSVRVKLPEPMNQNITSDPVYVIDDIATKNTSFFLSLKPSDLITIKIVRDPIKLTRFGLMGKNGIVIVQTKNGDMREPLDSTLRIQGLNRPATYKSREYSNGSDLHRPDFRSMLYWNPQIKTNANGKSRVEFFCSDDNGVMNIQIDGMTKDGKPFTTESSFLVRDTKGN
jgi:hypothetical protein